MLYNILPESIQSFMTLISILTAFCATALFTSLFKNVLPKDGGREFAVDGKKSAGKPRGAGIVFILVYVATSFLLSPMKLEYIFYLILVAMAMLTGFLDDASKSPWGEYLKGALDLLIAILVTVVYIFYNGSELSFGFGSGTFSIPIWVFAICSIILIWTSINVTNCADGVDGLSGTVSIVTLLTLFGFCLEIGSIDFAPQILIMIFAIVAYLWFNATPSSLMMGDAGSRAIGLFIAISVLKTGAPLIYIPAAIVLILDGGLGLVKVFLLRFLKISIFKNTRMPLHDHVRKVKGWSNTQCVFRFAIIQAVIGTVLYLLQTAIG